MRRSRSLSYDTGSETFTLEIDGTPLTDLETDVTDTSRPTFAGAFDAPQGQPGITGFVDLDPDGDFIVELISAGSAHRFLVSAETQEVAEFAICECASTHVKLVCEKKHCDDTTPPFCNLNDTIICAWITAQATPE